MPGERVIGEYSPSNETYKKIARSKIVSEFISLIVPVATALFEFFILNPPTFLTIGESLTVIGFTTLFTIITIGLSIAKLRTEFNARYVITSNRVVKIIKNRIKMDIPIEQIENAVITLGSVLRSKDYAVFFPPKDYMNLKGVNLNVPMVTSRVVELERMNQKSQIRSIKNKDGSIKMSNVKTARVHLKITRKTRRDMMRRSFLFLTEEVAREVAKKYWDLVKNNI